MKSPKYLRDARHLDKFMYSLMDELFYEPIDTRYRPWDEYRTPVTELLTEIAADWTITRDGFWYNVHPTGKFQIPGQGWKVHVSAAIDNAVSILKRAARIALTKGVPFKFALDKNVLATMSSKRWNRGGSGKFITMYPADLDQFKDLLEALYAELRSETGPYILSDKRYKDCRVLYYRYGGMRRISRTDVKGEQVLCLISPTGEAVPDVRTPYFSPPSWASDPFPAEKQEPKEIVLNDRYAVKKAIAFSNSGGVYVAEDRETGKEVIIKEARPHTAMDDQGNDAVKLLRKEYQMLELLHETGIAPQPLDAFEAAEHLFVAEEYLEGIDIREIMLTQSPLMQADPSLADSREYYEICRKTVKAFAQVVAQLHRKGIVFGDLSAKNIRIDPATHTVRLIDFEGAFRPELDQPTYLYTPGFKSAASIRKNTQAFEDDLFALAANMLYMLFPIAAFSTLRDDLFDKVLQIILNDIGWSQTPLFNVINSLAKNEMSSDEACELLDQPAQIVAPSYDNGEVDTAFLEETSRELGRFILANMRPDRDDALFPADPFIHRTNSLSLGFGASGVLYSLAKSGFEIPTQALDWLDQKLDRIVAAHMPPGLLTGASGIAWSLSELGREDRALELMSMANASPLLNAHHSYLYGMAGIGMANLHFYVRTNRPAYLSLAQGLGDALLNSAQENEHGLYWENDGLLHLGYGYGQSGVALFLLRLAELSGIERFRSEGRRALEFDLFHGEEREPGILSFPRAPGDPTVVPYLEEGSAGVAKVAIRYGLWDQRLEMILRDLNRKYAGFVGLLYGLGSFVDVLTDAFLFSNDERFLEMAKRPIRGMRDIYLLKYPNGWATPGDNLFRISCDYGTGTAGIMRTLHRFTQLDVADFTLDEVSASASSLDREAALAPVACAP